ncbi:2-phospho-L-lactate guanylyltransferase [Nocardia thailandica]|uniref:Phosphoenolpyruvate guanylyltransferase n=1 Tax=Nocardia thailandica TaxID=257275 RepID=A0ABW6PSA6_9NOCA
MRPHTVHVVLAVKHTDRAKTRLAPLLSPPRRRRLVLAMLADTLGAVLAVPEVLSVSVTTPDPAVAALVAGLGAEVLPEPAGAGLNPALSAAAAAVRDRHGPTHLLALQADLPALRPAELREMLTVAPPGRAVVADHAGTGTAALLVRDTTAPLMPRFGNDSAHAHRRSGATELTGAWPGLRSDVDTPADLARVAALGTGPETAAVLREIDLPALPPAPAHTVC